MSKLFLALFLALTSTAFASIWYVDGVNGNDSNDCKTRQTACKTIGHAISLARSGDTIGIGPATYTENLTIGISLTIIGAGAATTIIEGGSTVVTISNTNSHVALSKVSILNGSASQGGGIFNAGTLKINSTTISGNAANHGSSPAGGGIYNAGTMAISNSTLSGNTAEGLLSGDGGGIYNAGTLTISSSTLSGNGASGGDPLRNGFAQGGGIDNIGTLTISNSTLSGNSVSGKAGAFGGGIANAAGGARLTISNSTLSGNASTFSSSSGGGISNFSGGASTTLQNSIVANSPSGGNCSGIMTSKGYNLSSDGTCTFNGPGDLISTDPKLGPLQNNGGPTQTQALLSGSPAIDAGNPNGCTDGNGNLLKTDQRGKPRPDKEDSGGCDMGAFERQSD